MLIKWSNVLLTPPPSPNTYPIQEFGWTLHCSLRTIPTYYHTLIDHGLDAVLPWSWFWLPKKVLVSVMTWCHHFAFFVLLFHLLPSTTKRASSNHQGKTKDWKLETLSQSHAMLLTTASQTRCILAQRVSKTLPLYTLFWTKERSFIVRCHCTPVLTIIPHKWKQAFSSLQTHVRTVKMAARTDRSLSKSD